MQFDIEKFVTYPLNNGENFKTGGRGCIKCAMVEAMNCVAQPEIYKFSPEVIGSNVWYRAVAPQPTARMQLNADFGFSGGKFFLAVSPEFADLMDEAEARLHLDGEDGSTVKRFVLDGMMELGLIPKVEEEILAKV